MKKIVWITGASTGIGRELALRLAQEGCQVAASARDSQKLASLCMENKNIHAFALDITCKQSVRTVVSKIIDKFGRVDLAILNAGTYVPDNISNFNLAPLNSNFTLNFFATIDCMDVISKDMIARKTGQIAIISSVSGWLGLPYAASYGASKAALNNFATSLQPEMAKNGINLKLICPGFVKTPLTDKNDFEMPFIISAERAADEIIKGLNSKKFMISFPKRMTFSLGFLSILPDFIKLRLTAKILRD